jgi:hypothetical protein
MIEYLLLRRLEVLLQGGCRRMDMLHHFPLRTHPRMAVLVRRLVLCTYSRLSPLHELTADTIYNCRRYDDRQHNGTFDGTLEPGHAEEARALQVVEFANGEVIWSVLDTLRSPMGEDFDNDSLSYYFPSRGSYASQYSIPEDAAQSSFRGPSRSVSRAGNDPDLPTPDTKVLISLITGSIT